MKSILSQLMFFFCVSSIYSLWIFAQKSLELY